MQLVILVDEVGGKLWPVTSEVLPKAFLPVYSEKSLLEETILRHLLMLDKGGESIILVILEKAVETLLEQKTLETFKIPFENVLTVPSHKGSAWAMWKACKFLLEVKRVKASETVLFAPVDQFFWPRDIAIYHFQNLLMGTLEFPDQILSVCIPPGGPAPSMNYMEGDKTKYKILGVPLADPEMSDLKVDFANFGLADEAMLLNTMTTPVTDYAITPDYESAKDLLSKDWLWDINSYAGKIGVIEAGIEKALDIRDRGLTLPLWEELPTKSFSNEVIPLAIKNKLVTGVLIPKIIWSTLDNWVSIKHLLFDSGIFQHTSSEGVHLIESANNLVFKPPSKTVALYGVSDLIVIDIGDKLLIGSPAGLHEYF
jgi:mannose-1-phosphate guanylyltransferase